MPGEGENINLKSNAMNVWMQINVTVGLFKTLSANKHVSTGLVTLETRPSNILKPTIARKKLFEKFLR